MQLYLRLIAARVRAQLQYRASFLFELASFALITAVEFIAVVIVVQRFDSIGGWALPEIAILYGISAAALGCAEMIGRGFDAPFERMIMHGTFDSVLLRPHGTFFQVLASEFQVRRLGRVIQGLVVLISGGMTLAEWHASSFIALLLGISCSTVLYLALYSVGATLCFWTVKQPEVINAFTIGGQQLTSYPLSIFDEAVRVIFLSVVPLGAVIYPAALTILGRSDPTGIPAALIWFAPLIAGAAAVAAWRFWEVGVAQYQSSGT
jgi:ABC-2 type transport system permease protein